MKFLLIILTVSTVFGINDYVEVNRMPMLNLNIEDRGGNPGTKRFDIETKEYEQKLEDLYKKYQNDKNFLMGIVNAQNDSIDKLTNELSGFYSIANELSK
jgi:hypothetical protein